MPNKKTHIAAGAGFGALVLGILEITDQYRKVKRGEQPAMDWGVVAFHGLIGALVGGAFAMLPDMIEPATSLNHRRFFHSYAFAMVAGGGIHHLLNRIKDPVVRRLVIAAAIGYGSHLGLDARTVQGLPTI